MGIADWCLTLLVWSKQWEHDAVVFERNINSELPCFMEIRQTMLINILNTQGLRTRCRFICIQIHARIDQHSSQNASGAKESPSISRVRQLMQKLRAKKSTSFVTDQSPDQLSSSGMASSRETPGDTPRTSHVQRRLLPSLNTPYQRTLDYLQRSVAKDFLQ